MRIIYHAIIILLLLYTNVIMGQIAIGKLPTEGVIAATDTYSLMFGFVASYILVLINIKYNNISYFISTILLLYVNYTMSLIIEHTDINQFVKAYLNIKVLMAALAGTAIAHTIKESITHTQVIFLSEIKPNQKDSIYHYIFITFIVLETNVTMEMIHVGSSYIENIFNYNVILVASIGMISSLLLQFILFKNK